MRPSLSTQDYQFLTWVVEDHDVYMTSEQVQRVDAMIARGLLEEHPITVECVCEPGCQDSIIVLVCRHTDRTRIAMMCYDIWARENGR